MSQLLGAFRDAAVKCHIGFKHGGPWEECEWIECEDRRKIISHATDSPSDAEQLMELRSQRAKLEEALRSMALKPNCWCPMGYWWTSPEGAHSLRCLNIQALLNPSHLPKETQ